MALDLITNLLTGKLFNWNPTPTPGPAPTVGTGPYATPANSLMRNGGFETPTSFSGTRWQTNMDGWTSSQNNFELWSSGFEGVKSQEGKSYVEVDAERGTIPRR